MVARLRAVVEAASTVASIGRSHRLPIAYIEGRGCRGDPVEIAENSLSPANTVMAGRVFIVNEGADGRRFDAMRCRGGFRCRLEETGASLSPSLRCGPVAVASAHRSDLDHISRLLCGATKQGLR